MDSFFARNLSSRCLCGAEQLSSGDPGVSDAARGEPPSLISALVGSAQDFEWLPDPPGFMHFAIRKAVSLSLLP
jgi:hypothetical protein